MKGLHPWGSIGYVHHSFLKLGKLDPKANKCVFIRYPGYSKRYVMYGEHSNGWLIEIESCDIDFLKNDFPTISEVKGSLDLYELKKSQDFAF